MMTTTTRLILSASLLGALACEGADTEIPDDEIEDIEESDPGVERILADGEEEFGEGVTPIADIRVQDARFIFVEMSDEEGESLGIGTIHKLDNSMATLLEDSRLGEGSPLDLFLAVTPEGTDVPVQLKNYATVDLGERGWFIAEAKNSPRSAQPWICNNSNFKSTLRNWAPNIDSGERWVSNTKPLQSPGWTGPNCGDHALSCDNKSFYNLHRNNNQYNVFNVDQVKMTAAVCKMNPSRRVCSTYTGCKAHMGPIIAFRYRTENNASVPTAPFRRDMDQSDVGFNWGWIWFGSVFPREANFDWRTTIEAAKYGDEFDLGWIFEHLGR